MPKDSKELKVSIYLDDGRTYFYYVPTPDRAREHADAIITGGYRHNDGRGLFEHYPPHRILKVKVSEGIVPTKYPDEAEGT